MAITLPVNPSPAQATVGKNYLLYVNTGTPTVPVWTLIGGQRGSALNRKAESIDASNKTTGGWKANLPGLLSWSIALDGLVLLQDAGLQALEQAFSVPQQVELMLQYPDLTSRTGWASITELSIDNAYTAAATLKGTLDGVGPLSNLIPAVTPATATVSKSAATSQTFTITPSSTTLSNLSNGATVLTPTTQYTYSAGTLTIEATYLETLTVGTITLTALLSDGVTTFTVTINLTA